MILRHALLLVAAICIGSSRETAFARETCHGETPCKACKDCSQCRWCKDGREGVCGVCRKAAPAPK